jgi:mRNA-degrading endonuclease RelE of RelBE toxin-antitoxin system
MYTIIFSQKAKEDLRALKKSEPQVYKKARLLSEDFVEHSKTGRGKPLN